MTFMLTQGAIKKGDVICIRAYGIVLGEAITDSGASGVVTVRIRGGKDDHWINKAFPPMGDIAKVKRPKPSVQNPYDTEVYET